MARIRTIKPEFFRHRSLYLLEQETGLPIRVAFAGLWTVADREGRFRWEPAELKLDCLPYDDLDFSRVLDALTTRGFLVRYACGTRQFGFIPSFKTHQHINVRESQSNLPAPPPVPDASPTRDPPDDDAARAKQVHTRGEGKGREEEGKGSLPLPPPPPISHASPTGQPPVTPTDLIAIFDAERQRIFGDHLARAFPAPTDLVHAQRFLELGASPELCRSVFAATLETRKAAGRKPIDNLAYFVNPIDEALAVKTRQPQPQSPTSQPDGSPWPARLRVFEKSKRWEPEWGPPPGQPGCLAPQPKVAEGSRGA